MWRTWTCSALALAAFALPASALAQDLGDLDARMCRNGAFARDASFQMAEIVGEGRAYFLADTDGCPEAGSCREAAEPYVVTGDRVVVSKLRLGHACAFFPNEGGGSAGYVPLDRLRTIPTDTTPAEREWLGT